MTDKEDKRTEKRRLAYEIPKGAPKAVKVWSLTKEGKEFLERLWKTFPTLAPKHLRKDLEDTADKKQILENVKDALNQLLDSLSDMKMAICVLQAYVEQKLNEEAKE